MKEEAGGSLLLTDAQKQWLAIQKMLTITNLRTKWQPPKVPKDCLSFCCDEFSRRLLLLHPACCLSACV